MNKNSCFRYFMTMATLTCCCAVLALPQVVDAELQKSVRAGAKLQMGFLYLLSDFSGAIPSQWARVDYDQQNNEIYTHNPQTNEVQIFNHAGMEIFTFGGDGDIPSLIDIAIGDAGKIYGLPRRFGNPEVQVFNYRGQPESVIIPQGLPEELRYFRASRLVYQDGKLYLLDSKAMILVLLSLDGTFLGIHDLGAKLREIADRQDPEREKTTEMTITDFNLDPDGNIYFTAPLQFTAFRLNIDGTFDSFGRSGSGPGKFGVISGIAADEQGNIYVADRLRSVVLLFNRDLQFQGEFGYRGGLPEDLLVPNSLAVDQHGNRVFVSQGANKGVGAYKVIIEE